MKIEQKNKIWHLSGDITESCDLSNLGLSDRQVVFDFGSVRVINSVGVRSWIQNLAALNISPTYQNCPPFLIELFSMIPEFLARNGRVTSFQVPTYCENCGTRGIILLQLGVDFEPGKPVALKIPPCIHPECKPEADIIEETYFYFVTEMLKN